MAMKTTLRSATVFLKQEKQHGVVSFQLGMRSVTTSTYTSRTMRKHYRPKPSVPLPLKDLISARKKESYEVNPTPVVEPFMTDQGEIEYRIIKQYYTKDDIENEMASYDSETAMNNENGIENENENLSDILEMATKHKPRHSNKNYLNNLFCKDEIKKIGRTGIPFEKEERFDKLQRISNQDDAKNGKLILQKESNLMHRQVWPYKKWLWRSEKNMKGREFDEKIGLSAFMDDENTRVGRAWYTTELRLKSNEDLWRLWYVLLREKNMLNTLRFQCRAGRRLMPNYGRISKVNKSMKRLQYVWQERTFLKLLNKEMEQQKKFDEKLAKAIEYRRVKRLQLREDIKQKFHNTVSQLERQKIAQTQNTQTLNENENEMNQHNRKIDERLEKLRNGGYNAKLRKGWSYWYENDKYDPNEKEERERLILFRKPVLTPAEREAKKLAKKRAKQSKKNKV